MSKSHLKAGNKPPHISTWWTKEHSEKLSEKMKGNTYKLGIKETEVTRKRKKEAFAKLLANSIVKYNSYWTPVSLGVGSEGVNCAGGYPIFSV